MTRRLRTTALGTAAALCVGLIVALAPPASAEPSFQLVDNQTTTTDADGTRHIFGEILNNGSTGGPARVDLLLLAADGSVVGSAGAPTNINIVSPGRKASFEVQVEPSVTFDRYQASVAPGDSTSPLNHAFTATGKPSYVDQGGDEHLSGTVRNDNSTAANNVSMVFTFYAANRVIGSEAFGIGSGPLGAGQTIPFDVPVNPAYRAYDEWTATVQSDSAPSGSGEEVAILTSKQQEARQLVCDPALRLSTKTVSVGRTTTVSVSGATPGSLLTLEGYSRPSTQYAPIRSEVQVASDGTTVPFAVRPPTSARVRLQVAGCSTPGTGQVISVIPGLGITVTRVGLLKYRFDGKILPGKQNTGRAISLYIGRGTATPVKKVVARSLADGRYSATVVLARGATRAYWATGADMTNLAGKSAVKAFSAS